MDPVVSGHGHGDTKLKMPVGAQYIRYENKGSTGLRPFRFKSHSPQKVENYILERANKYGIYIPTNWDCEDHCFVVASEVRCKFWGQPLAIALGKAKGGSIAGQDHALLILWFQDQGKWMHRYFDPTLKKFVDDFDTYHLIPLPINGFKDHDDLPFPGNLKFHDTAAYALDGRTYDYDLINGEVMDTLKGEGIEECPAPEPGTEEGDQFDKYWAASDRVFYWFAHLRYEHKGTPPKGPAPIGIAFGTAIIPGLGPQPVDMAALVLWKQPNDFIYWEIDNKTDLDSLNIKFQPRVVIV